MQKRTYLTITQETSSDAKRAAGTLPDGRFSLEYDPAQKLWFARADADLEKVKAWLPENTVSGQHLTESSSLTPAQEFAEALRDAGFVLQGNELPEMDGKRHRIATEGDKPGQRSGVYAGYLDGHPAGWYQNHRASEGKVNWSSTGTHTYDPAEAMKQRALTAQKRWDRELTAQADYARMGERLAGLWEKMPPAPDSHPYLARKGVPAADGVRLDKYDNVVVPLRNIAGDIRTLQYIKPDGEKNLKKGAEKTGNFFVVGGTLSQAVPVLYAEGYATAASLNQATGLPVVMTVDAGNMVTVSQKLKALYPETPHVILGEDDFTKKDNKGVIKAQEAAAAIDGHCVIPQFTQSERDQAFSGAASFSDFNDIHRARGLDAVRDQLAPALDPLVPDWRQPFTMEHTMPDTQRPQDSPALMPGEPGGHDEYAAYLADSWAPENDSPAPETPGAVPETPVENPVPELAVDEPAPADDAPVVAGNTTPEAQRSPEPPVSDAGDVTSITEPADDAPSEPALAMDEPVAIAENVQPEASVAPQPPVTDAAEAVTVSVPTDALPATEAVPAGPVASDDALTPLHSDAVAPQSAVPLSAEEVIPEPAPTEDGFNFTFGRLAGDASPDGPAVAPIDLDALLQGLASRQDGRTWIYALDGEDAFRDFGDRIVMATPEASNNDRMILAALLSAKANQRGPVEVTGSDAFIERTLNLIADHRIEVHLKNPHQRAQFEAILLARAAMDTPKDGLVMGPPDGAVPAPGAAPQSAPDTPPLQPVPASAVEPKPANALAPEMSVIERETLRTGLTGKLLDAGKAPYQFDKNNTDSFYVQLRTKDGNKTYWGVELEQALSDSGTRQGEMVKLQFMGKKPVTVNVPVKDVNNVVTGFKKVETHRNHWSVTPAMDNQLLVANKNAVVPAQLSAYDGNAFWALQQQLVQTASLTLATLPAQGHGLLYTGPDGKGQPAPDTPPIDAPVPDHAKAAGSVVMHATGAGGELMAHLVKGHGDYLQGVVRHDGELRHVLGRLCTSSNGSTFVALNHVQDDGKLHLIGNGSAVNTVKNGEPRFDTFAFQMKGKDAPKFAVPLVSPEKIPPALHSRLGFQQAYTPPKADAPAEAPRPQAKPAQPQPM